MRNSSVWRSAVARVALLLGLIVAPSWAWGAAAGAPASFEEFARRARGGERLSVVFFGASLTWGANATDPLLTSYRAVVARRLEEAFPQAHFHFHDAAIGGTGSQLGAFRLERDVLRRKPDLVFLDFSANDGIDSATPETLASYEAIVRRIITEAKAPVVQVIFPFQWDVARGTTDGMRRRDAHIAISRAYGTGLGDAIELAQKRVKAGEVTLKEIWPVDGVHPGNRGYELFADAAWGAFMKAVEEKKVCAAPAEMLHATTYMTRARVRIASLAPLPDGWRVGAPNLTSAYFDMLMSRWLDDLAIASNVPAGADPKSKEPFVGKPPAALRAKFTGSMVMLFGETTPASGRFKVTIDGKSVPRKQGGKVIADEFDAGEFGRRVGGSAHLVMILAEGLDPAVEHALEIVPMLAPDARQDLRIESICVAGGKAAVRRAD